jgi:hypothetical protein
LDRRTSRQRTHYRIIVGSSFDNSTGVREDNGVITFSAAQRDAGSIGAQYVVSSSAIDRRAERARR